MVAGNAASRHATSLWALVRTSSQHRQLGRNRSWSGPVLPSHSSLMSRVRFSGATALPSPNDTLEDCKLVKLGVDVVRSLKHGHRSVPFTRSVMMIIRT